MTGLLRLFRRDPPDRELLVQMRALWRVPPTYTLPTTARVVATKPKPEAPRVVALRRSA